MSPASRSLAISVLALVGLSACSSDNNATVTASDSTLASSSSDSPDAVDTSSCGLTLVAASMRSYCGITGTADGDNLKFDHPDSPTSNGAAPVLNTAGQELGFGVLKVNDTKVAYFLAVNNPDGSITIVDLVDAPPGAVDYNTDVETRIDLYDDTNTVLASYDVVGQNLVPV